MRRTLLRIASGIVALSLLAPARAADPPRFEWKDGDRVVMIGDTLVERDQKYGYLEALVTARNPDKAIVFRNLGWSGDTVYGHARAGFGKPPDGFKHLKEHVLSLKPTVLIVGYGMAESFDGKAGLPGFVSGLNALLDAVTESKPRLILLSPIAHEDLGRPLPDPARHNRDLALYRDALKTVAAERSAWFVDLFQETLPGNHYPGPLTDNGIHPTDYGHWYVAARVYRTLHGEESDNPRDVRLDARDPAKKTGRPRVSELELSDTRARFRLSDATLPLILRPTGSPVLIAWLWATRTLGVAGLAPGTYKLTIDGRPIASADAGAWARGVYLLYGPEHDQSEALRKAIVAKNELYFYRWRPQNETYLLGFRKHEQGNNAREIPLFDPLVEEKEKEIARLRKPVSHVYELTRDNEVAR